MSRAFFLVLLSGAGACVPGHRPAAIIPVHLLPFPVDSQRAELVAPGVTHRFIHSSAGPWAIHVLDVDRRSCYSAAAVKGFPGAAGRRKTSAMLAELDSAGGVIGGVNADFFRPNGMPTNAHITRGRVIAGPSARPVLAFDSAGVPHILTLRSRVRLLGLDSRDYQWNRSDQPLTFLDSNWGGMTDSASAHELVFAPDGDSLRLARVDTSDAGVPIPAGGGALVMKLARAGSVPERLPATRAGVRVRLDARLYPMHPMEAVGGRPLLARDSVVAANIDSAGGVAFASSRHPRTAVGIAGNGTRLLFVTVDGRQKPYSDGMTLRELASLMLALGARDALNLDGGGSTTMVVKSPATRELRVVNRPSDAGGERAVGNALAVVQGCASRAR